MKNASNTSPFMEKGKKNSVLIFYGRQKFAIVVEQVECYLYYTFEKSILPRSVPFRLWDSHGERESERAD